MAKPFKPRVPVVERTRPGVLVLRIALTNLVHTDTGTHIDGHSGPRSE
jgi:hypothetical protein